MLTYKVNHYFSSESENITQEENEVLEEESKKNDRVNIKTEESQEDTPKDEKDNGKDFQSLEDELKKNQAELNETKERMLRFGAELENSRKRFEKEKSDIRNYAIQEFSKDLLTVVDSFDKAMQSIEESNFDIKSEDGKKLQAIVDGVKIVSQVFEETFKKHGIEKVPGKGSDFDPLFHNAIAKEVQKDIKKELVAEEFVSGYKIGERVLRTAMVKVAVPEE
jgi:molecular chaperone GrpE